MKTELEIQAQLNLINDLINMGGHITIRHLKARKINLVNDLARKIKVIPNTNN